MKKEKRLLASYALVAAMLFVLAFNQYMIQSINGGLAVDRMSAAQENSGFELPKGPPAIYGAELGVSFDKVVESLNVLSALDGDLYPDGKLKFADLNNVQQGRYLKIGSMIACEFCCGASTLVFSDGQPACGCSHSAAMRGLAKYLLINHGDEYTDQQILDELTKWKTMFFPKQMAAKYASDTKNVPDMVGGC
ncbi:MAG: hypothetical protein HY516_01790 [Candidatus Aenigmarchaeota archaeon]|nr:hypothetical protein [Candidatus Aenigmarchaeota archaeon]